MLISHEDMAAYIRAGLARPWTYPIGPDHQVWTAAKFNGRWYAVMDGGRDYQELPHPTATLLTVIQDSVDAVERWPEADTGRRVDDWVALGEFALGQDV